MTPNSCFWKRCLRPNAWAAPALLLVVSVIASEKTAPGEEAPKIDYQAPEGWIQEKPSSGMRYAQFRLPKVDPDKEDAILAVFYFPGSGGNTQDNLDRWIGQVKQPDGSPSRKKAETKESEVNGMKLTVLKLSGNYKESMGPMMREATEKPGYRLAAAVLETKAGPFFFKLAGPEKTVRQWEESFQAFLGSVKLRE